MRLWNHLFSVSEFGRRILSPIVVWSCFFKTTNDPILGAAPKGRFTSGLGGLVRRRYCSNVVIQRSCYLEAVVKVATAINIVSEVLGK